MRELDQDDIVERLKDHGLFNKDERNKLFMEAAGEIERLRAALAECAADFVTPQGTILEVSKFIEWEFARRMKVADAAMSAVDRQAVENTKDGQ